MYVGKMEIFIFHPVHGSLNTDLGGGGGKGGAPF